MQRLSVVAAVLGLAACGTDEDDRPQTLEYVTAVVLAPNCGNAQCHSSFRREENYAFDTIHETRLTLMNNAGLVVPGEPNESLLYTVLISPGGDDDSGNPPRMPYDQPMANKDIQLIYNWIEGGAEGLVP